MLLASRRAGQTAVISGCSQTRQPTTVIFPPRTFRNLSRASRSKAPARSRGGITGLRVVAKSVQTLPGAHGAYEIVLNGKSQLAVPDNQASANIMSLEFATSEGINVERIQIPFILADGSLVYSIGRVTVDCALQSSPHSTRACQFYIFLELVEPIILGRKFLHDAGLSRYPTRVNRQYILNDDRADVQSVWTTRSLDDIEYSRWQLKIALRHSTTVEEIDLVCDKGSDINVMSLAYAQEIGIYTGCSLKHQHSLQLADGRITASSGIVYVSIQFQGRAGRFGQIPLQFVLIDSLPFQAAVGNPVIEQYRIFEDMHDFDWTFTDDEEGLLCMLSMIRVNKADKKHPAGQPLALIVNQTYRQTNETAVRVARESLAERQRLLNARRNASTAQTPAIQNPAIQTPDIQASAISSPAKKEPDPHHPSFELPSYPNQGPHPAPGTCVAPSRNVASIHGNGTDAIVGSKLPNQSDETLDFNPWQLTQT